jgi:hypothetical protein
MDVSIDTDIRFKDETSQLSFFTELDYAVKQIEVVSTDNGKTRGLEKAKKLTSITSLYSLLPKRFDTQPDVNKLETRRYHGFGADPILISIYPAAMDRQCVDEDGEIAMERYYRYPSLNEDIVEEGLAYMAFHGAVDRAPDEMVIRVQFTIRQLIRSIKTSTKISLSHADVTTSLEVLAKSSLTIEFENTKAGAKGRSITNRIGEYNEIQVGDSETIRTCKLHPIFAKDINRGMFRIHDLELQGSIRSSYGRDLYRQLVWLYQNANGQNTITLDGRRSMENSSCGFSIKKRSACWQTFKRGLDELVKRDVIKRWDVTKEEVTRGLGRPVIDNKMIEIWPSERFIKLQKMAYWSSNKALDLESESPPEIEA